MRKFLSFTALLFFAFTANAQLYDTKITFVPTWRGEEIQLNKNYLFEIGNDTISFERIAFYVSNLIITDKGNRKSVDVAKPMLMDISEDGSNLSFVTVSRFKQIKEISFDLGIDSITNTAGAIDGDLDPTKGMYWTWQSGYINVKIEGKSSACDSRRNEFQLHLGGYSGENNAIQTVRITPKNSRKVKVEIPMDQILSHENIKKQHHIMSPSTDAVQLSKKMAKSMRILE